MGNVAHNIHPIAGQGLNLSIKELLNLQNYYANIVLWI